MESQWIEAEYVFFGRRIFLSGCFEDKEFCIELNEEQREKLWDYNEAERKAKSAFLTKLLES